jgi:hypothetical protein
MSIVEDRSPLAILVRFGIAFIALFVIGYIVLSDTGIFDSDTKIITITTPNDTYSTNNTDKVWSSGNYYIDRVDVSENAECYLLHYYGVVGFSCVEK